MWKQSKQTYWQATPFRAVARPGIQIKVNAWYALVLRVSQSNLFMRKKLFLSLLFSTTSPPSIHVFDENLFFAAILTHSSHTERRFLMFIDISQDFQ